MPAFTKNQLAAIDIDRLGDDACIVAGPGSGKTTVLVERYRQLVRAGVSPHEILAITFTEKAAANMKAKVAEAFAGEPDLRRQIEAAHISTVHGFCQRLLKENAIAAGIDPRFSILDERQGQIRRARCAVETLDMFVIERREEIGRLMSVIDQPALAGPLVDVHDAIRSAGISFETLLAPPGPDLGALMDSICAIIDDYARFTGILTARRAEYRDRLIAWSQAARTAYRDRRWDVLVAETAAAKFAPGSVHPDWKADFAAVQDQAKELLGGFVARLYAAERRTLVHIVMAFDRLYTQDKQRLGALDFSDLEHFAIRLLENNARVRDRVQSQFRQILMDEYQDTNGQQARLLRLLRGRGNFYAVGDINQSIFGFRYASPEVFRSHRDEVKSAGGHHVELFENFRSREGILRAVGAVIEAAEGVEPHALVARRDLPSHEAPSVEVTVALAAAEDETRDQADRVEAEWIASRILELRGQLTIGPESRAADFRDMAVLVRKSSIVGPLTEAFNRFGVRYQVTRQLGFFESREIRDLMHLLRAISNPCDEVSLAVVLRSPLAGLSDEALLRIKIAGENLGIALNTVNLATLDPVDAARLERFRNGFERWRSAAHYLAIDRLLSQALADCGYTWLPETPAGTNIEKLFSLARIAPPEQSLAEFVHEVNLIREEDAREADAPFDEALNAVRVITTHASKGLEFPIVFIPGIQTRMGNSGGSLTYTAAHGLGSKWRPPHGGDALSDYIRDRNKKTIGDREIEESNRLLYVAMTRAEEHLILSYALGPKDKPQQWAVPVARVFGMGTLEPDAPPKLIETGLPGKPFSAAIRAITRSASSVPVEMLTAFDTAIEELPKPAISGQHESNVAVTSLSIFAGCPRKYYLARYLGWDMSAAAQSGQPGRAKLPASELGRQVHALLAGLNIPSPDLEALRLADTFDKGALGRRAAKARRVEREFDFMFAIDDAVLRGQIDLWFEDRAGSIVVDYKTDDIDAGEASSHASAYELQLLYYALAIERITGELPAEAWLHFLRPDITVRVELTPNRLQSAQQLVQTLATAQQTNDFPLVEGPHCARCPFYRGKCPAGKNGLAASFASTPTPSTPSIRPK